MVSTIHLQAGRSSGCAALPEERARGRRATFSEWDCGPKTLREAPAEACQGVWTSPWKPPSREEERR